MKEKTLPVKNGNGSHAVKEAVTQVSEQGHSSSMSTAARAHAEMEEVKGYSLRRRAEGDDETSNTDPGEAVLITELDEPGSEVPASEAAPLDALFASYTELLPLVEAKTLDRQMREVIIGDDDRVQITPTTDFPYRAICSLKITAQDGSRWIGTGWLISPRTLATAGHCVYMHDHGGWPSSIEVIPGLDDDERPFGSFTATTFKSVKGWTKDKKREFDYGAIILPGNSRPGDATGYFGYTVRNDNFLKAAVLNISGYPGDKAGGNQQWFMALNTKSVSERIITYDIDTMGGQSGAPVWVKVGNTRYAAGIHTNGHGSGNSATRIVRSVFNNLKKWKSQGM